MKFACFGHPMLLVKEGNKHSLNKQISRTGPIPAFDKREPLLYILRTEIDWGQTDLFNNRVKKNSCGKYLEDDTQRITHIAIVAA